MPEFNEAREHEAFEAAMRERHPEWSFTPDPVFGYHNERTRCALDGWQAAKTPPARRWRNLDEAMRDPLFHACRGIMGTASYGEDDALFRALTHYADGVKGLKR